MASQDADNAPFIPVTRPKALKKACFIPQGDNGAKPEVDTEIRIVFQLPNKPRDTFNPAYSIKQLFSEWIKHDASIAIHSLTDDNLLYPAHKPFPTKETDFQQFFLVHSIPKCPTRQNLITIGCCILSTKTVTEVKKSILDDSTMMDWLNQHHVFLEADTLGHEAVRTIGYFFNVHPRLTHKTSFKANIRASLAQVTMMPEEVIDLDPLAKHFYDEKEANHTDDIDLETAIDLYDAEPTDIYIPPFELLITNVGYSTGTTQVSMRTLGIKTNVAHGKLLHELLLCMATTRTDNPILKYVPVGMAYTIGPEHYKQLIRANNAYLTSLASIPIIGISDNTLEQTIPVQHPTLSNYRLTIKEVLLCNDWCVNIEPTETDGKIFVLTTKAKLDIARQWLDENLPVIFTHHLPKNPTFTPDPDNPIAKHTDQQHITTTLLDYADALKATLPPSQLQNMAQTSKYARPPPNRPPPLVNISYKEAITRNNTPTNNPNTNNSTKKWCTQDNTSTTTKVTNNLTDNNPTAVALADLKQEILSTVRQDIAQLMQREIAPMKQEIANLTTNNQTLNNTMVQLQQQMAAFSAQMATYMQQITQPPLAQPHSASSGGGAR